MNSHETNVPLAEVIISEYGDWVMVKHTHILPYDFNASHLSTHWVESPSQ